MALKSGKTLFTIFFFKSQFTRNTSFVRIVEVGPRDGLQNESVKVPAETKIEFINKLSKTGLKTIEATSFVSPKWIPQMEDNVKVFTGIKKESGVTYQALVPNVQGLKSAIQAGVQEVAIFVAASEGFSRKNINCSVQEGLNRSKEVIELAKNNNIKVRGYISCVVGCPYNGNVPPSAVTKITEALLDMGCYEISLGDTIGVGTKITIEKMLKDVLILTSAKNLAIHCHDTYGQALLNVSTALEFGITVVDSSVAGLGGCPFARGATGNVATEDVIYMLDGMGVKTGIDLNKLVETGRFICDFIKKSPASRVNNALYSKYYLNK